MENNFNWYALRTKPRWEKKISLKLAEKEIDFYCPLQKKISQWSDRKKIVYEPIFKGFIFVRLDEKKTWEIKNFSGITNFIYWLGKPAIVRDEDIENVKKFLDVFGSFEVYSEEIEVNNKVRVKAGPLMNYEGILLNISGNKAIVRIDSMGLFLSAHVNKNILELVNSHE